MNKYFIFGLFSGLILATSFIFQNVKAQDKSASTTDDFLDEIYIEPVKTDFEVLSEQAIRISKLDILLSKYAQEVDRLRNYCGN